MADFTTIAKEFVTFYYQTFDGNREQLLSLYGEQSMLTFEGSQYQGAQSIVTKLIELPFKQVKHEVATQDAQPSNENGGILVIVTGALMVEAEQRPMSYTQTFQLLPRDNSYFVFNDVFRLVYPAA